jgi:hypothetical protein
MAKLPVAATKVEYWAVAAGSGARLDDKAATPLKDKQGQELDTVAPTLQAKIASR